VRNSNRNFHENLRVCYQTVTSTQKRNLENVVGAVFTKLPVRKFYKSSLRPNESYIISIRLMKEDI